jgi:hypothetical protein
MLKLAVNGQTTPLDAHTVHNAIASSSLAEEFSIKKDQIMRPRVIPLAVQREANKVQAAELDRVQKTYKGEKSTTVNASVLLLSGCQDNQTSSDGLANGLFTQKLKQVWNKRKPSEVKSYTSFYKSILKAMPPWQTPNQYSVGLNTKKLSASAPFSI